MTDTLASLISQAISPNAVRLDGSLTIPRTYGVFELSRSAGTTRKIRYGNFPVRQTELLKEFGACKLVHLFKKRDLAQRTAKLLNEGPA